MFCFIADLYQLVYDDIVLANGEGKTTSTRLSRIGATKL